jgi:hypothetical protein
MTIRTPTGPAWFVLPACERPRAPGAPGTARFGIRLQGDHETVFLDV